MKNNTVLVELSEDDVKDITILVEKRYALQNLEKIIGDNNSLQNRCNQELNQITDMYNNWWNKIINQYHLPLDILDRLIVDCENGEIIKLSE